LKQSQRWRLIWDSSKRRLIQNLLLWLILKFLTLWENEKTNLSQNCLIISFNYCWMIKIRSFKCVSFVKKFLHFKCIHLYNAIKILTLSLIRKASTFLHIRLIQISMSKTSLILSRKSTEFHGKKCIGRLLHFHITLNVRIVNRTFSFQNCFIVYNIKKKIWNSLERTSNFINAARRTKNDSPWSLKFRDARLRCINFKKQRSLNK